MKADKRPTLTALTGLRFFAALHVVLFHFFRHYLEHVDAPWWLRSVVESGYVGVDFFFLLSGFIMVYSCADDDGALRGSRRAFYVARFARIYPLYALSLLLAAPLFFTDAALSPGRLVGAAAVVFMVQAYWPPMAMLWNYAAWSLSVEALFYAIFPFVIGPITRLARRPVAASVALWMLAVAPALLVGVLQQGWSGIHRHDDSFWIDLVKFNPVLHLAEFLLGGVVCRWMLDRRGTTAPRLLSTPALPLTAIAIALMVASRLPYVALDNGLLAPLFLWLIVAISTSRGAAARALSSAPMTLLGDASYGLYILQVPLWQLMIAGGGRLTGLGEEELRLYPALVAVYVIGLIAISVASVKLFEHPARLALRRMLDRRR